MQSYKLKPTQNSREASWQHGTGVAFPCSLPAPRRGFVKIVHEFCPQTLPLEVALDVQYSWD